MIGKYYFLFLFFYINLNFGQILPTIPGNVFRFTFGNDLNQNIVNKPKWDIGKQEFNLKGIGRHYFNNLQHNDSTRFSSNYDLYYNGAVFLDPKPNDTIPGNKTVEDWISNFNSERNLDLPVFGKEGFDTSNTVNILGSFHQKQEKIVQYQNFVIEYGMSNEITLSLSIPLIKKYHIFNSIDSVVIGKAENVNSLINYHINSKNHFSNYLSSNEFSNLPGKLRDSIQTIYDYFYTPDGRYSVDWVFHSQDNPINNKLIDSRFFPITNNDTISLDSLINYYYPIKMIGQNKNQKSKIDDVTIGATILLKGKPAWISDERTNSLYGKILITIPFGPTINSFKSENIRQKQFKEIKIGSGVTRLSLGVFGGNNLDNYDRIRFYFQTLFKTSVPAILNTPVSFFSGGHSHPDSILSIVGNTYKFDKGSEINLNLGSEIIAKKNKFLFKTNLFYKHKMKDEYVSNDKNWDNWMEEHIGYSSSYNYLDFNLEFWLINSFSKTRLGPLSFDVFLGFNKIMYSKNTFDGFNAYLGFTSYYQGW